MHLYHTMGPKILELLFVLVIQVCVIGAVTNLQDTAALNALKDVLKNLPPNWVGSDPCGSGWEGIGCTNSRVISITLSTMNLEGHLTGDVATLSELQTLDLSYNKDLTGPIPPSIGNLRKLSNLILVGCSFSGPIPDTIGNLERLIFLSINSNNFSGPIPPSIGKLTNLYWLDLADNQLTGGIPVSNGTVPGLDLLIRTKHFHMGMNQLSGPVPPKLFNSDMVLIHVLFEDNRLSGALPDTLGLVQTLEVVRFDRNSLSGTLPSNLNNLTSVSEMFLSNNKFTGLMPDLTGMNLLSYLDMSNNTFDNSAVPSWVASLQSLTTLEMEDIQLQGQVPAELFGLPHLQTLVLKNNLLNGTLNINISNGDQLQLVDLERNRITEFALRAGGYDFDIILAGNPICLESGAQLAAQYCTVPTNTQTYTTPPNNCSPPSCSSDQTASPNCQCAYPYTGILVFRAFPISKLRNTSLFESLDQSLMQSFRSHRLPVDSISLSNPRTNTMSYLQLDLEVFPSGQDRFNRTGILTVGFELSNQTFKPPDEFGPFYFDGVEYEYFAGSKVSSESVNIGLIVGATVGGAVLLLLLVLAGIYAFRQKKRAERATGQNYPFAHWDSNVSNSSLPQLKGARWFSFEELKKYTYNFSDENIIGAGGYGKVYRGTLPTGKMIAIKRAQQGSMQGGVEFKTEIELLSRVHHKNLVSLLGFCFEKGEQILVYEYIANGTLLDSLSGKSGIRMDWMRRLKVVLGAARGLAYLHDLANPPIIHRDVKTTNILLDENLIAKVADFGLSKPIEEGGMGHITTQVKGTMGYMDPEYYMTQQLTEKSDVYSFGVVMLELVTGRRPIERGKYIVREVKLAMDNLDQVLDAAIVSEIPIKGLERFVNLAMSCAEESGDNRPTMSSVVKEIENIMQLVGLNPNAESASTSETYDISKGSSHPYSSGDFDYSGGFPPSKLEPA